MVKYTARWEQDALDLFSRIFRWYLLEMGTKAANKFRNGVLEAVERIETNPYIGVSADFLSDRPKEYFSLLIHPHYRLLYYIESDIVYLTYFGITDGIPKIYKTSINNL